MSPPLRYGVRSQAAHDLQNQLNQRGAGLVVSGHYDEATEQAVQAYQLSMGLVADGIAGTKTLNCLAGGNSEKLLKSADLVKVAIRLDVPLASVYAVNEVESNGMGFLANGEPVILFERHIMYRLLSAPQHKDDDVFERRRRADQLAIIHPSIVNPKAGGYSGGMAEHQRLHDARLIDDCAALQSTSWGAFQIMGFHWRRLGYARVQDFAVALSTDESQQFDAFTRFIETDSNLLKALRVRNWSEFARLYNGPDFQKNKYDVKLLRAYERYAACGYSQTVTA